jgi:hypothetical protein
MVRRIAHLHERPDAAGKQRDDRSLAPEILETLAGRRMRGGVVEQAAIPSVTRLFGWSRLAGVPIGRNSLHRRWFGVLLRGAPTLRRLDALEHVCEHGRRDTAASQRGGGGRVGLALEVPGVFRLHQCGWCERDDAAEITDHPTDDQCQRRVLQNQTHPMAVLDVSCFVRQHAEDFAVIVSQVYQCVGDDDDARRQRDRIRAERLTFSKQQSITGRSPLGSQSKEGGGQRTLSIAGHTAWPQSVFVEGREHVVADGHADGRGQAFGDESANHRYAMAICHDEQRQHHQQEHGGGRGEAPRCVLPLRDRLRNTRL